MGFLLLSPEAPRCTPNVLPLTAPAEAQGCLVSSTRQPPAPMVRYPTCVLCRVQALPCFVREVLATLTSPAATGPVLLLLWGPTR